MIIPVHDAFLIEKEGDGTVPSGKYRDPEDTKGMIPESMRVNGCQTSRQLTVSIGYSSVNNTFRRCVAELMEEGRISNLYPDKRTGARGSVFQNVESLWT